jgi:23S rRNA pseudouridine1911/1915/1917 synthase
MLCQGAENTLLGYTPRMPVFTHTVPDDPPMLRLDAYCAKAFPVFTSRNQARKAIKEKRLLVDGEHARTDWFPKAGMEMAATVPESPVLPLLKIEMDVLYQDPHLAVVFKPAGIQTRGNCRRTVHRALRYNMEMSTESDALPMPDPCHRLDYKTSGLLIVARTVSCRVEINRMFAARQINKRYRALVTGRLDGEGEIDVPLDERACLSRWRAVEHTQSLHVDWFTTVELEPVTGRTHQLRRHMAGIDHAILGDDMYTRDGKLLRKQGLFLAALHLDFIHPMTGEEVVVDAPEPRKFTVLREREARRWERHHSDTVR